MDDFLKQMNDRMSEGEDQDDQPTAPPQFADMLREVQRFWAENPPQVMGMPMMMPMPILRIAPFAEHLAYHQGVEGIARAWGVESDAPMVPCGCRDHIIVAVTKADDPDDPEMYGKDRRQVKFIAVNQHAQESCSYDLGVESAKHLVNVVMEAIALAEAGHDNG